jgi:hypothetical protein
LAKARGDFPLARQELQSIIENEVGMMDLEEDGEDVYNDFGQLTTEEYEELMCSMYEQLQKEEEDALQYEEYARFEEEALQAAINSQAFDPYTDVDACVPMDRDLDDEE